MTSNTRSSPSGQPPDIYSKSKALEGLPAKFVAAMRTLFDILDEEKSGFILLADFEMYMRKEREEEGGGVPLGVVESLRYPVFNIQTSVPAANLFLSLDPKSRPMDPDPSPERQFFEGNSFNNM
jgi:hypothetical protein